MAVPRGGEAGRSTRVRLLGNGVPRTTTPITPPHLGVHHCVVAYITYVTHSIGFGGATLLKFYILTASILFGFYNMTNVGPFSTLSRWLSPIKIREWLLLEY